MQASDNRVEEHLAVLRRNYIGNLPAKLAEFDQQHGLLQTATDMSVILANLRGLAHKLAGSAGTFGCPEVSSAARNYEWILREAALEPDCSVNIDIIHSGHQALKHAVAQTLLMNANEECRKQ